jgi:hypothetical protein
VHGRVKRLHSAVHHLRESGDLADVSYGEASRPKRLRRPPGRHELPAELGERAREIDDTGLVRNRQKCARHGGLKIVAQRAATHSRCLGRSTEAEGGELERGTWRCAENGELERGTWRRAENGNEERAGVRRTGTRNEPVCGGGRSKTLRTPSPPPSRFPAPRHRTRSSPRTPPPHSVYGLRGAVGAVAAFATAATIRVSDRRSRRSITSAGEWL